MATHYTIQLGKEIIDFEGPDGLTDSEIEHLADTQLRQAKPGQTFPHSKYVGVGEPSTATPPEKSSAVGAFIRNLPRDAYFNWGDEFASASNALVPGSAWLDNTLGLSGGNQQSMYGDKAKGFWDTYRKNMSDFSQQQATDEEHHGTASALGDITGVLGSLPAASERAISLLPKAAKATMNARPYLTALGLGGAGGAISGAGAGEGNRTQSAAAGALTGAALAFGLTGAIQFAPLVAKYAKMLFKKGVTDNAVSQMQKALVRDGYDVTTPQGKAALQTELARYGAKPVSLADVGVNTRARTGVGLRTPSAAQQQSIDVVGARQAGSPQRLATDIRQNVAPRTDVHALDEDLRAQRAAEAEPLRDKALFDAGPQGQLVYRGGAAHSPDFEGPSFFTPDKEAAQTYATAHAARFGTPGEVYETNVNIQKPAPLDIVREEAEKLGMETRLAPASIFDPVLQGREGKDQIRQLMNKLKQRGYDGAILEDLPFGPRAGGGDSPMMTHIPFDLKTQVGVTGGKQSRIVDDPELQNLARLPLAQRALTAALNQVEAERGRLAVTGKSIEHLPDLTPEGDRGSQLDMRSFDVIKRFLDDEVTRLYKRGDTSTFSAAQANEVKELRNAIRDRLKIVNPEYGDYLGAYKGSSEMIDSLEQGRNFDNLDPEQIAKEQGSRSTAGQELYRVGAARNLLDKIRDTKDGAVAAKRILNSPESRAQLAATGVTPSNMTRLGNAVEQERTLSLLPEELKGSQTDARRLASQDAEGINLPFSGGFSAGGGYGWLGLKALGQAILNRGLPERNALINEQLLPRMLEQNPEGIKNIIAELEQHGEKQAAAQLRRLVKARQSSINSAAVIGGMTALPNTGDQ